MAEGSLEVEDLTCGYGDNEVLRRISFSVENEEFVGIIGPNASGKSTLLRAIDRVIKPAWGTVFLDGEDMETMGKREIAQRMAAVPQELSTGYSFTALEMVTLGRTPHLGPLEAEGEEDMSAVREAMDATGTWELANRPFAELSGGERQRVIIAKALAQEPSVLLLDEPVNHLDINNQLEILDLIEDMTGEGGKAIVATFHDLNTAARYCDSLILLHERRIHAQGPPEEVLSEDNIEEIYGAEVSVRRTPETNSISVTPISGSPPGLGEGSTNLKVHLVCGGGTGKPLMHSLIRSGCRVSAGVLSPLDDDYREARRLGIRVVEESPFLPIGRRASRANWRLIEGSDLVILTDMPVGEGNLNNLELVARAAGEKSVILVEGSPMDERDFTEGEARELYSSLKEECTARATDPEEVMSLLDERESPEEGRATGGG